MTLHSLVLISDSFSCNCNSIQSPVSIVHLRVNLILSHPLLRLYINQHSSNAIQFNSVYSTVQCSSNLHSNVSRSTRIKSSSVHTYIFVCFTLRVILQGFVDPIMQQARRWARFHWRMTYVVCMSSAHCLYILCTSCG